MIICNHCKKEIKNDERIVIEHRHGFKNKGDKKITGYKHYYHHFCHFDKYPNQLRDPIH